VKKELNSRIEWWKEKQAEIENEFKVVYKAQDKMPKGHVSQKAGILLSIGSSG